jgi:hypothetical protein
MAHCGKIKLFMITWGELQIGTFYDAISNNLTFNFTFKINWICCILY